jgi:hypothetical protein
MNLHAVARALAGVVNGRQVLAPGPNHSPATAACRSGSIPALLMGSEFIPLPAMTGGFAAITCARA